MNNLSVGWIVQVLIDTGYGMDDQGLSPNTGNTFAFSIASWLDLQPTSLLYNRYKDAVSPRVKQQGCEADHQPSSSTFVKNDGTIPSLFNTPLWHSA
jgi:hypothetical protein